MSSTVTDLPLHEVVLKIMFHENTEKAAAMTAKDVLWRIDNPEISERQVREVLNWLVRQKKAELYLGKYSIDRIEFLEQKELYEQHVSEDKQQVLENKQKVSEDSKKISKPQTKRTKIAPAKKSKKPTKRKTFYINPPKVKKQKHHVYVLVLILLSLAYLTYTFLELEYSFPPSETLKQHPKNGINTLPNPKKLYVSDDDAYTESTKKAISYSFSRQNTINSSNTKELNRLQHTLDSITRSNKIEMLTLEEELQKNIDHSNTMIKKSVFSNCIIIMLFVFLYFKFKKK